MILFNAISISLHHNIKHSVIKHNYNQILKNIIKHKPSQIKNKLFNISVTIKKKEKINCK